MIDNSDSKNYTQLENLDNGTAEEIVPTAKGDTYVGRQKVYVTLPSGENVWITGSTYTELIQNALRKYGSLSEPLSGASESFREYTDQVFDVFLKPRWKPSTADTNKFLLDKHILPYFGEMDLSHIHTADIQKFFQTKQHLSKSYTKQMLIMLHEIFENAVEDKKIKEDPTMSKRITLPKKIQEKNALDPDKFYDIISHIDLLKENDRILMALLCFTGMRRGEILGLKWENVIEDKILVRSQVVFNGNTSIYNEYTKSASGIREVPIPVELKPYLVHRGEGLVLGGDTPYTQSKFARAWQRIGKTIELYGATPHTFRHTYLSILAASGVDPKTIQALAGHSDFGFTFNKYISRNTLNMQNAGSSFSEYLKKITPK